MTAFSQNTGTTQNYSLALTDLGGLLMPTAGPPVWSIISQLNADSSPAVQNLVGLAVSPDGLRAQIKAIATPGTVTIQVTGQIAGRGTVVATLTLTINAAPVLAPASVTAAFSQTGAGPI
jgi:hypothetical protein